MSETTRDLDSLEMTAGFSTFVDDEDQAQISQLHDDLFCLAGKKSPAWCAPGDADEDLAHETTVENIVDGPVDDVKEQEE